MSPEYQEYYQQLLAAFHSHEMEYRTEMEVIEACFKSSLDYWGKICKTVKGSGFHNKEDEISFFRVVKPAFTSFIEYYTYRYHAILFVPSNDAVEVARFWRWEEKKIQRFFDNNGDFCRYIKEGATHRDTEYFLRASDHPDKDRIAGDLIHDFDTDLISPKDPLVTIMKAYELYEEYIKQKLQYSLEA